MACIYIPWHTVCIICDGISLATVWEQVACSSKSWTVNDPLCSVSSVSWLDTLKSSSATILISSSPCTSFFRTRPRLEAHCQAEEIIFLRSGKNSKGGNQGKPCLGEAIFYKYKNYITYLHSYIDVWLLNFLGKRVKTK